MSIRSLFRKLFKMRERTMAEQEKRVRAWLLMKADRSLHGKIREVLDSLDDKETTEFVYIRADQVENISNSNSRDFNLIAAIDASDESKLRAFISKKDELGLVDLEVYIVPIGGHSPPPPHSATGFLSEAELEEYGYPKGPITVTYGRQDNSPGFNPWG